MDNQIDLIPSRNGELNVQYNGKVLYSRYNPSASVERLAGKTPLKARTIYFIPSPLLGYGILTLMESLPEDSILIAVETDQQLMAISTSYISNIQKKGVCEFFRLDDPVSLYKIYNGLSCSLYRSCCMIPMNGGYQLNREKYDSLFSSLEHYLQNFWQNRMTSVKLGELWMKNLFSNLSRSEGQQLSHFKTDRSVLLAGAGESLEGTIPLIKERRERFFILAVDTAVQTLVRSGIIPDAVVNLEAQFHNLKDFYSLSGKPFRQFADLTAYPPSLRRFKGEQFYFSSRFSSAAIIARLNSAGILAPEIPALGSVGVTALYVATEISDGPIFLTGLDFSYIPGKSHATDSPFHDWARLRESRLNGDTWYGFSCSRPGFKTRGKGDDSFLRTNAILVSYCNQLKDMCRLMDREIYDIAKTGLDLQIPAIDHSRAKQLADANQKHSGHTEQPQLESRPDQMQIHSFIRKERKELDKLIKLWDELSAGRREAESLLPSLHYCDYLFYHFPDTTVLPNTSPSFLVRAITSARSYRRLLDSLLT
ncbi:MAG: hypothetical protein B6241_04255 [Spirochaetaceae bacterium 4572_59]|nr:MAG: hypothetical protein B6241_04255 [Spirochaetaceae bacterium 4572_59]